MTWQEELRRLDEDFSAGNITADEYRVRRDQVLSSAVAPPVDEQVQRPAENSESTQIVPPVQPPGPNQQPPEQHAPSSDATQVVDPSLYGDQQVVDPSLYRGQPDADRTQAVPPSWEQHGPSSGGFPAQFGPTSGGFPAQQPYPGGFAPQQPYGGFAPQQPHSGGFPAQQPAPMENEPLWGGDELPAAAPPMADDWINQGPEWSKDDDGKGRTGKIIGGVLGVVVLLGLAFGAWWLWLSGDGGNEGQRRNPPATNPPSQTTSAAPTSQAPEVFGPLILPEGEGSGPVSYAAEEVAEKKPLPEPDLKLLSKYDLTEARSVVVRQGSTAITLWSFSTDDADKLFKAFLKDQKRFGFKEVSGTGDDVPVASATQENNDKKVRVYRAHYVSDSLVIRVEAFNTDKATAREAFNKVLSDQLDHTPAN